jgi:hypothetical protein
MLTSQVNFSQQVFSILSCYPQWLSMIIEAVEQPLMDRNYCPEVIERLFACGATRDGKDSRCECDRKNPNFPLGDC